jgi:cytidyltransferase-like protein
MKPNFKTKILDPSVCKREIDMIRCTSISRCTEFPLIITANGSFEILHPGHINFLKSAAMAAGDNTSLFVVSVNSDAYIRDTKSRKVWMSQEDRMLLISEIEFVDFVVPQNRRDASLIIEIIQPNIHCVSSEYKDNIAEMNIIDSVNAELKIIDRFENYSSSEIIKLIRS